MECLGVFKSVVGKIRIQLEAFFIVLEERDRVLQDQIREKYVCLEGFLKEYMEG